MTDLTPHPDDSPLDAWTLEGLLDGDELAADHRASPLAGLIEIVRAPGDPVELRDEAAMLAMFRESVAVEEPGLVGAATPRTSMLTLITRSKLVVAATAGALTLGAASAAAYTGVLPDSMQSVAHELINAPAPHGVGPDATGPAAKGLCTAFLAHEESGATVSTKSVAFRNLATAAGGEENVATYCATVLTPTASPTETATATDTATSTATATATETATATTEPTSEPTTSPMAKGQGTANPGQGAAQWTAHGKTKPFPGQGASHWPKATSKPGKAKPQPTTTPTTVPTTAPTATATATS